MSHPISLGFISSGHLYSSSRTVRVEAEYAKDYEITPYDDIHMSLAMEHNIKGILSADKELDRVDFIRGIEPLKY